VSNGLPARGNILRGDTARMFSQSIILGDDERDRTVAFVHRQWQPQQVIAEPTLGFRLYGMRPHPSSPGELVPFSKNIVARVRHP
jgi:hypothetical protein